MKSLNKRLSRAFWWPILTMTLLVSCDKYLEIKPDQSLALPNNVSVLQALLDFEMRWSSYPASGDYASDFYYLNDGDWASRSEMAREVYLWHPEGVYLPDWLDNYRRIFDSNVVLENIDDASLGELTERDRSAVKGSAYFLRGWTYYHLAQLFTPHYSISQPSDDMGLPLRLSANINDVSVRASLKDTYSQILFDLRESAKLLPIEVVIPTRPSRAAAFAALARVCLVIGDYQAAEKYADSCLQLKDKLIDYNAIDPANRNPFEIFGEEVLLHALIDGGAGLLNPNIARVDSTFYKSYDEGDLRKTVYFYENPDGSHSFKGTYSGNSTNWGLFAGLAVDEIFLTRAESRVRLGNIDGALNDLNKLLNMRWERGVFQEKVSDDMNVVLNLVLKERFKCLVFRGGVYWADLKRLNKEPEFRKTLTRKIGDQLYELTPDDPRYTFLIPQEVINLTGMVQNRR